jgi:hypothetical protein
MNSLGISICNPIASDFIPSDTDTVAFRTAYRKVTVWDFYNGVAVTLTPHSPPNPDWMAGVKIGSAAALYTGVFIFCVKAIMRIHMGDVIHKKRLLLAKKILLVFRFVVNAGVNRRRWEHAELECQRLNIELTRASQVPVSLLVSFYGYWDTVL